MNEIMNQELSDIMYKSAGREGPINVTLGIDREEEPGGFKRRSFTVTNALLALAAQDKDLQSPVRRKTHTRKSGLGLPRIHGLRIVKSNEGIRLIKSDASKRSRSDESLKTWRGPKTETTPDITRALTTAFKKGIAADLEETMTRENEYKEYSRRSIKLQFPEARYKSHTLTALEASLAVVVLDKIVDELGILRVLLPQCPRTKTFRGYKSIEERYSKHVKHTKRDMDYRIRNEDLDKLQRERAFIEDMLLMTTWELMESNSYGKLLSVIVDIHRMDRDDEDLVAQWPQVRSRVREVRAELRAERDLLGPQALARALVAIQQQDEIGDTEMLLSAEQRYVDTWEAARCAQQATRNGLQERALRKSIDLATLRLTIEARAAHQTKALLIDEERRLELALDAWEQRRFADLDSICNAILKARNTLEDARAHVSRMQREVARRESELEAWRARRAEDLRQQNAAGRIQRCWRAFAYRRVVALALASMRRGRLVLLADAQQAAENARMSVRARIAMQRDHVKHVGDVYARAFQAIQALLGVRSAQQVFLKEWQAAQRRAKKGGKKGGKKSRKSTRK